MGVAYATISFFIMTKKCIICTQEAVFSIKGSSECYCEECAKEHFGDLGLLLRIEDEAHRLQSLLKSKGYDSEKF